MITTQGWNAFLKCIEEPPKYTIFMFCTTDPQKIPATIINRCEVHSLGRLSDEQICERLGYICTKEGFRFNDISLDYIAKLGNGSMRQAISYLDKCKDFSTDLTIQNVIACLGNFSYDTFFNLTNAIIDGNTELILSIIDSLYYEGSDLKVFISKYLEFLVQVIKYIVLSDISCTSIPKRYINDLEYLINIDDKFNSFNSIITRVMDIKREIKIDNDIRTTIQVMLISRKGGEK